MLLQSNIGSLYEARSIRAWLYSNGTYTDAKSLKALENIFRQESDKSAMDMSHIDIESVHAYFGRDDAAQRGIGAVSFFSALILEIPESMINMALGSFLIGLAVYFGFIWTRDLDTNAGPGDLFFKCHYDKIR